MKKLLFALLLPLLFIIPTPTRAAESAECTINSLNSKYELSNGNFDVTSTFVVDCGTIPDKHGIYLTLQKRVKSPIAHDTPVHLIEIVNEKNESYKYEEVSDDQTITWKIGDPNKTITGVNTYKIRYTVEHVMAEAANNQTEIYWDFLGNQWKMKIQAFSARIVFPSEVTEYNAAVRIFDGLEGSNTNKLSNFQWFDNGDGRRALVIKSNNTLTPGQGITASITFPNTVLAKDVYKPTFGEKYGNYFWLLLPILLFVGAFLYWRKYGKDPKSKKTELVQYEPPHDLLPLELGIVQSYGSINFPYITATIVDMAVRGYLTIEKLDDKSVDDWQLTLKKSDLGNLKPFEKTIVSTLFGDDVSSGATVLLSQQKYRFFPVLSKIKDQANEGIKNLGLIDQKNGLMVGIYALGLAVIFGLGMLAYYNIAKEITWPPMLAFGLTLLIGGFFLVIMRRRTSSGAEAAWQIRGFQMYLGRAEKYRMEFYEKEGIFEKYLPYAVAFGLTKEWLKRMHDIYKEKNQPMTVWPWYISAGNFSSFGEFSNSVDSMISQFSHTVGASPSSSTSGGGGFSGGGGGGGGGGSW